MAKRTPKKSRKHNSQARKPVTQKAGLAIENYPTLQLFSYEITDEPLDNSSIPKEVQDEMEHLFVKAQKSPAAIIDRLEELIKKYPEVPQLYNFISAAYSNLNDKQKSKYYIETNYQKNQDYLFAKLNYAELCMMEGNYEKVPDIFNNKFDIKAMYPERDVFHITEVVSFMGIAGLYFAHIGKEEQTEIFYEGLKELAPNHPYTKRLKQQMLMKSVREEFKRLIGRR